MLRVFILSVNVLHVIMLSVIMLSVIMLRVVAPLKRGTIRYEVIMELRSR
jgi:hypothetical protein